MSTRTKEFNEPNVADICAAKLGARIVHLALHIAVVRHLSRVDTGQDPEIIPIPQTDGRAMAAECECHAPICEALFSY